MGEKINILNQLKGGGIEGEDFQHINMEYMNKYFENPLLDDEEILQAIQENDNKEIETDEECDGNINPARTR